MNLRDAQSADGVLQAVQDLVDGLGPDADLVVEPVFLNRTGLSLDEVRAAVGSNVLFHVEVDGQRLYPAFYADPSLDRGELELVTTLLGHGTPGSKLMFFTTPKGSCARASDGVPRTPLQALRDGDLPAAMTAAKGFAVR